MKAHDDSTDAPRDSSTSKVIDRRHLVTGVAFAHPPEVVAAACLEVAMTDVHADGLTAAGAGSSRDGWWRVVGVSDAGLNAVLIDARNALNRDEGCGECLSIQTVL
jgi:hypothetical protein